MEGTAHACLLSVGNQQPITAFTKAHKADFVQTKKPSKFWQAWWSLDGQE